MEAETREISFWHRANLFHCCSQTSSLSLSYFYRHSPTQAWRFIHETHLPLLLSLSPVFFFSSVNNTWYRLISGPKNGSRNAGVKQKSEISPLIGIKKLPDVCYLSLVSFLFSQFLSWRLFSLLMITLFCLDNGEIRKSENSTPLWHLRRKCIVNAGKKRRYPVIFLHVQLLRSRSHAKPLCVGS